MKTYLTYGVSMSLASALLTLILFFLGFHSDPAKLGTSQWISSLGLLAISVTCLSLGMKARRAEVPLTEEYGYGSALFVGFMISLFAGFCSIVTNYLYFNVINPGFTDIIVQAQLDKMEAKGLSGAQLEQAEKGIRMFMNPIFSGCFVFLSVLFWGTLISLVAAAFLKRPATEEAMVTGA
jgi:hypothetical protein